MSYSKPTVYAEIRFRSRLEARWAAMFDLLGWTWEYEPETPGAYIPDFLIHGVGARQVFVEVKPLAVYLNDRRAIIDKARHAIGDGELLVVTDGLLANCNECELGLGFLVDQLGRADPVTGINPLDVDDHAILFRPGARKYGLEYDLAGDFGSWEGRLTGAYDGNALFNSTTLSSAEVAQFWSRAGNAIQWKPDR